MTKPSGKTWGIYVRVSTRHQAEEGFSLQDQRDRLTEFAKDRGWSFRVFDDAGESGESLEGRPGLVRLLDLADSGAIEGILVTDESRLARDELTAALIRDRLKTCGVKLATLRGELDLTDPSENFIANVLAAAHAFEQDLRTEKMKRGLINAVRKGYWPGGPAPYGYRLVADEQDRAHKRLQIDDEEASVLRLVVDLILDQGHSTYSAATYLTDKGIRTRRGRPWRHPNLSHQLRKGHLTGTWTYRQGGEPIEMEIPAIFTQAEWDRLQAAIRGKPRPQRQHRLYPLSGRNRHHLFCQCGSNFFGMVRHGEKRKRRAYYTCAKAHASYGGEPCSYLPRSHRAIPLEEAVWNAVHSVLTNPEYLIELANEYLNSRTTKADSTDERHEVHVQLDHLERQETRIVRDLADQDKLNLLDRALGHINEERAALENRLDELDALEVAPPISERQLRAFAEQAQSRLDKVTPELMAEIFDLLDIQLHRVDENRFEGTGTIPIPDDGDLLRVGSSGEVWKEGPRHP